MSEIPPLPWQHSQKGVYIKDQRGKVITEVVHARMEAAAFIVRAVNSHREWQPIETAPQDGTRILFYQQGRGAFEGWWHDDWPHAEHYWRDDADSEPTPSHWRPLLPSPPIQQAKSEVPL